MPFSKREAVAILFNAPISMFRQLSTPSKDPSTNLSYSRRMGVRPWRLDINAKLDLRPFTMRFSFLMVVKWSHRLGLSRADVECNRSPWSDQSWLDLWQGRPHPLRGQWHSRKFHLKEIAGLASEFTALQGRGHQHPSMRQERPLLYCLWLHFLWGINLVWLPRPSGSRSKGLYYWAPSLSLLYLSLHHVGRRPRYGWVGTICAGGAATITSIWILARLSFVPALSHYRQRSTTKYAHTK